jgi:two-component system, NarL family, nitrate/nitrite response regulator NarL
VPGLREEASDGRVDCDARPGRLRVVVVEGNEIVRRGLVEMVRCLPMAEPGGGFESAGAAWSEIQASRPDVLLVSSDLDTRDRDALTSAAALGAKIVVLIRSADPGHLAQAIGISANAYVMEPGLTGPALREALERVARQETPMPVVLSEYLLLLARGSSRSNRAPSLTPREEQALALLAEGLSNKQIARRLSISEHGAKRHVGNVLAKLNCPNRTLAAAVAVRGGLIPLPIPSPS